MSTLDHYGAATMAFLYPVYGYRKAEFKTKTTESNCRDTRVIKSLVENYSKGHQKIVFMKTWGLPKSEG